MGIKGHGINAYLRNMNYKSGKAGAFNVNNQNIGTEKNRKEAVLTELNSRNPANSEKNNSDGKIEEVKKPRPLYGLGQLMDFKA